MQVAQNHHLPRQQALAFQVFKKSISHLSLLSRTKNKITTTHSFIFTETIFFYFLSSSLGLGLALNLILRTLITLSTSDNIAVS